MVEDYHSALDVILDIEPSSHEDDVNSMRLEEIESTAEVLYGLIHARYIISSRGLQVMSVKFQNVDFGRCFRVLCEGQPLLPVGQSDLVGVSSVNVFCAKCCELYFPRSVRQGNVDGAYFGTTFPHLFLLKYPALVPERGGTQSVYIPRIYGFRIHKDSEYWANGGGGGSGGGGGCRM
jgi:casein kinase II subunit beta